MPDGFPNGLFGDTKGLFFTDKSEIDSAKLYINTSKSTQIESQFIDLGKVDSWFREELKNIPVYNTISNNCSTEVEKAIEAGGINLVTPIDSPWHLESALRQELTNLRIKDSFNSLFY